MQQEEAKKDQWGILELMGHVRLAGRISEEERFGAKMGRIDIPVGEGFITQYFGGSSIYRLTMTDEASARAVANANKPHPVHNYEMPPARPALAEGQGGGGLTTASAAPWDEPDHDHDDDEPIDDFDDEGYF